ncbi:histidine phosphatase superfamily, clade-1 [Podospora fimiseda]|uniref:Histidine phosphatase superfamily, clade-1 n=1 Tax=Podospora fimiseda TaxID=252190 RepID=A0AAN7BH50_9PEZI|nr:histidine phosphatase superfamily, clade-1 [Podospora fimiseda]
MANSTTIYLLRHAESQHNVTKDFSLRDPGLTPLGITQATALRTTFPALSSIGLIISSPLTRTIETTIAAFDPIISSGQAKLILDPLLQERSDLPCDIGSELSDLKERFPGLGFNDWEKVLEEGWWTKAGLFAADDETVRKRAGEVRRKLLGCVKELEGKERKYIVVVTHGVFMKFLAEDEEIDLAKAGWRGYKAVEKEDGEVGLIEI